MTRVLEIQPPAAPKISSSRLPSAKTSVCRSNWPVYDTSIHHRRRLGQDRKHIARVRWCVEALGSYNDFRFDRRHVGEFTGQEPASIGRLRPRWPQQADVGLDPRGNALARDAVGRFPSGVAEKRIGSEALFDGLALEHGELEH